MNYQLIKAFHIIFMVAWFAGLFYIFRLFVYHVENWEKDDAIKMLSVMERKLLNIIMTPAMIITLTLGIWMFVLNPELIVQPWMHIKLTLVFFLIVYHFFSYYVFFQFQKGNKILSSKSCRMINEIPTLVLISVCVLAILKPVF